MAIIISISNMKGGVGKSSTACSLAAIEDALSKRVLLIDNDAQGNATNVLGIYNEELNYTIQDVYINDTPMEDIILKSPTSNIDVIPANSIHSKTQGLLYKMEAEDPSFNAQIRLRNRLKEVEDRYDYIFIDNCPVREYLHYSALIAADYVITPVNADQFSYDGLENIVEDIVMVKNEYNPDLEMLGIMFTQANMNTTIFKQLYQAFLEKAGEWVVRRPIRMDNSLKEACSSYMPIYRYRRRTKAGTDYIYAAHEMHLISDSELKKLINWHGFKNDNFDYSKLEV